MKSTIYVLLCSLILCVLGPRCEAQFGGGGRPGGGGGQGGQGGQGGNGFGGIAIDADGLLSVAIGKELTDKLALKKLEAAAKLNVGRDMAKYSELRKVSLVKLEQAVAKALNDSPSLLPIDMQYFAGLQRIDYVFIYPESNDIVIAGPAEGFASNSVGRMVGVSTGRPPLRLEDFVVALRSTRRGAVLGCSIDPLPANHSKMIAAAKVNSGPSTPAAIQAKYQDLTKILGNQDVTITGLPKDSRFAQVFVEADYRMKLMSVGREVPNVKGFHSQLDMQKPGDTIYQRWWFTPHYESLKTTEDGNAFQFSGPRLKLLSQDEFISEDGQRTAAADRFSAQKFAKLFTEKFPEIAVAVPVMAELQNLTDLAILSALMRREGVSQKLGWKMELFLNEKLLPHQSFEIPTKVSSIGNWKRSGQLMLGLIGGVRLAPESALQEIATDKDSAATLDRSRARNAMPVDHAVWWWD